MKKQSTGIMERIRTVYYKLTETERKVADYVLANADKVQYMSIAELAQACSVADSSVFRFCRSLDMPGFTGFRLELAKNLAVSGKRKSQDCDDSVRGRYMKTSQLVQQALDETFQLIDEDAVKQAVTMMEQADRVLVMGSGGGSITAEVFVHMFSGICNKCKSISDPHMQYMEVASMTPKDVLIVLTRTGATINGINLLRHARECGVPTVLVTRFPQSPAAEFADVILRTGYDESPLEFGTVPGRLATLMVAEMLLSEYYSRNRAECEKYSRRMVESISSQHV